MKTKLYKKFVTLVCDDFKISRKQLFSRDFDERLIQCYAFNLNDKKLKKCDTLTIVLHKHPLSQIWNALCFHERWLFKYWKHSRWKSLIQIKLDIGQKHYESK